MSRYKKQLNSDRWKRFADDVKRRDGYMCVQCGSTNNLQVHHKVYHQVRSPWDYTIDLLETLCGICHKKKHEGISIETFVAKTDKEFKRIRRNERAKNRQISNRKNIFRRGMTADEIHNIMLNEDNSMKHVYEVYTFVENKYTVIFSSEDKDVAYEYLHQHADKDYRMLSLFTYQKINNETETSTEESKTISKEG